MPAACTICDRQKAPHNSIEPPFVIFENSDWVIRHSQETNILGYVLIESKRHFLDMSEANQAECHFFGTLLKETVAAVRAITKPERVYTVTLAEVVPHFHVHVIPRTNQIPKAFRGRGILNYPLQPHADPELVENVCMSLKRRLRIFSGADAHRNPVGRA